MKIKCKGELYEGSLDMIHCGFAKWYQAFGFRLLNNLWRCEG